MIILGILLFALLVVLHEFGHFLVARRNGVEVEEFGIGFPPKLFGRKMGKTEYTFNLIPLGGFVKLKGESDEDETANSFGASSLWVKTKILLAGVGMNFIAAAAILTVLALTGLPQILPGQYHVPSNQSVVSRDVAVAQVSEGTAAERAGIEPGDTIVSIDGQEVAGAEELRRLTSSLAGEEVDIAISRNGEDIDVSTALAEDTESGALGVAPVDLTTSRYTWAAPLVGVGVTLQMTYLVLAALGGIIAGLFSGAGQAAVDQVAGPVGVVFLLQNLGNFGWEYLLVLIASISVSLAVFNALPIPALDGGRLAVIAGARALRRNLSARLENAIHGLGFVFLIGLLILITYVDVQRFF